MINENEKNITVASNDLYEVSLEDYKAFIQQLKPEIREVRENYAADGTIRTEVYSNVRNVKLCSRICNPTTQSPEKYYIWELSNAQESQKYIPRRKVVLDDPKQVKTLLNYIKEHPNG